MTDRRNTNHRRNTKETYNILYADPPWRYEQKAVQGAAEKHYPTMSIDELCALPVETLAEKDCLLFLWATFPQLPEALRLIKAWGFTFKTVAFVWLKLNRKSPTWFYGLGYWTRGNAENLPACQAGPIPSVTPKVSISLSFPRCGTQQETRHYP